VSTRRLEDNKNSSVLDPAKKPGYGFGQGDRLGVAGFGHHAGFKLAISEGGIFKIYLGSSRVDGRRMNGAGKPRQTRTTTRHKYLTKNGRLETHAGRRCKHEQTAATSG